MSLSIFFDPLDDKFLSFSGTTHSFGHKLSKNDSTLINWQDNDLAIIGVDEYRGSRSGQKKNGSPDSIRKALYPLACWTGNKRIIDFGNLRAGEDHNETYERLKSVQEILFENEICSIIIGGSQDLDYAQYSAAGALNKMINFGSIDSGIDFAPDVKGVAEEKSHLHKILLHEPNYLYNICNIGYQTYLVEKDLIDLIEKLYFEGIRLGALHDDITEIEPFIRNLDILSFDISSIRGQDAMGQSDPQAFGLSPEQACQLTWYAGHGFGVKSLGIFGYQPKADQNALTAKIIATMIWYFVEGFTRRNTLPPFDTNDFQKFTVTFNTTPSELVFYKNLKTDKWWMEIPLKKSQNKFKDFKYIPCSYNDYLTAGKGEIPNKWILAQSRIT